jgi:hypothetical protein
MKLGFLELPEDERRLYIEQAATRRSLSPMILEKDFWVCWLLGVLFESKFAGNLVFKGGTSLSKVFGVIDRFSEDVDLSLSPEFLGLPEAGTSRNQANKWMAKAEAACGAAVQNQIAPVLEAAVAGVVQWKSQFFGSSWANYDEAKPGTFRLVPPSERIPPLRRDYQAMRDMYLSNPVSFDKILAALAELEKRINSSGP